MRDAMFQGNRFPLRVRVERAFARKLITEALRSFNALYLGLEPVLRPQGVKEKKPINLFFTQFIPVFIDQWFSKRILIF